MSETESKYEDYTPHEGAIYFAVRIGKKKKVEYVGQHNKMDIIDRVQQHEREDEDQPWGPLVRQTAMYRWEVVQSAAKITNLELSVLEQYHIQDQWEKSGHRLRNKIAALKWSTFHKYRNVPNVYSPDRFKAEHPGIRSNLQKMEEESHYQKIDFPK